jgi:hypothetical protein
VERIRQAFGLAVLACLLLLQPAAARASSGDPFDHVIGNPVLGPRASAAAAAGPSYPVAGGQSVHVQVDPAYGGTDALQRILDVLGAAPHGAEMNSLNLHIADTGTLDRLCGQNSTACYLTSSQTMVVSGSPVNTNNQMPQAMVITHEYGHHIEANRSFDGWYATNLGGRHWATYEHVCEGVAAGRLVPGDQGAHYWDNPGEAFAQAYATMLYPNAVPWWWSFAQPDEGAFQAIREDVADTSPGTTVQWSGSLTRGRPTAATSINATLDGPIGVSVRGSGPARFQVSLVSPNGTVLRQATAQGKWPGKKGRTGKKGKARKSTVGDLSYGTCVPGSVSRSFQLRVTRLAGKGKFTATISKP